MHCNGFTVCFSHPLRILRSTTDEWEAPKSDNEVPHRVDTGFDRLRDIGLVSGHFQSVFIWQRENGTKCIGFVRSRENGIGQTGLNITGCYCYRIWSNFLKEMTRTEFVRQ